MGLSSILVSLVLTLGCVRADIYLHVPRGSNNRLNEVTATRKNANRLFDSENNNRGGYNVGDATKDPARSKEEKQYKMKYFQSSEGEGLTYLTLQWTNQHGCGGNEDTDRQQQNCNLVLQYMCQDDSGSNIDARDALRNGVQTSRQIYTKPPSRRDTPARREKRRKGNVRPQRGLHESWDWYDRCYVRNRNNGLFTADQILKRNRKGDRSAVFTRQNPTGKRYGYECPEERDYFPYWHPTPWKDIAVLAQNASICSFYQSESFNVKSYGQCVETYAGGATKWASKWNNAGDCEENGGRWVVLSNYLEKASDLTSQSACLSSRRGGHRHIWAVPYDTDDVTRKECLVALEKPHCSEAPWTRPNHLGNGRGGYPVNYTWALPHFPSGNTQRCVIRMRYNISTNDYDPYNTDARHNNNIKTGVVSPVTNDPSVDLGVGDISLRLAINTAQYGRVFQDRSHVFILRPRPAALQDKVIYNLNVLGKRGNIVQVFPAVEYDFYPTDLQIKEGDLVHIQWTGSNTHLNKGAGNDGEGKAGTDRSNMVQINGLNKNFPVPYTESTMWKNAEVVWHYGISDTSRLSGRDLAVVVATSGYNSCETREVCGTKSAEATKKVDGQLNNAPASFEGVVVKFQKGVYYYMCTRNNNFTNRNQKGTIRVS